MNLVPESTPRRGLFLSLEGTEGAGKTTLANRLGEALAREGFSVCLTREPGGTELGKALRRHLLHSRELDLVTETLLFLADRRAHCESVIKPALARGEWVISDRFSDSTLAYQGYGRGLRVSFLRKLNEWVTGGLVPDRTFLLDLKPEIGLARLTEHDRIDRETLAFHRRVRRGFLRESRRDP
ncbi:MAG: dTMP kinase, partial [Fimbriimonadales bacterium]|nr:dTMP kinase [Fimbriimonadales bacterium]